MCFPFSYPGRSVTSHFYDVFLFCHLSATLVSAESDEGKYRRYDFTTSPHHIEMGLNVEVHGFSTREMYVPITKRT